MQQLKIDFEDRESSATIEALQQPLADSPSHPDYIRPDRQEIFEDKLPHQWPDPQHDRDAITIDRVNASPEIGLTHRFTVKRDDTVRVFFNHRKTEIGQVIGISHANQEVKVRFQPGSNGLWFAKGTILPQPEPSPPTVPGGVALHEVIEKVNAKNTPPGGFEPSDELPQISHTPYTLKQFRKFRQRVNDRSITLEAYLAEFETIFQAKEATIAELKHQHNAKILKAYAQQMGSWHAHQNTKEKNAIAIFQKMLLSFTLDGVVSYSMDRSYEKSVAAKVRSITAEDFQAHREKLDQQAQQYIKSVTNPETLLEFSKCIDAKGLAGLTNEQLARWDALHADLARERRAKNGPSAIVTQFEGEDLKGVEFCVVEGYHTKRECPLWIVQLSSRVERTTFKELNGKAKMLGGRYSSFKKDEAGFQFFDTEAATRFTELLGSDTDRTDILERRKERRELNASERLHELADTLLARADETIATSEQSLQNTARRADMQAGVRGRAYADQALARSLHSVAEALSTGEVKYLDGVRHKTHLEALDTTLYLAKLARIREIRKATNEHEYGYGLRVQHEEEKPYSEEDVQFTEYPQPTIYKRHLEEAIVHCRSIKGAKMLSERMRKRIARTKRDHVTFTGEADIAQLTDFLSRAKYAGYDTQWMDKSLERYKRLQAAHLGDVHELRSALREYLPHKASLRGDDPVQIAERELIGKKLPGFFPTPKTIIQDMLKYAEIEPHHRVLEPSCGKGDIVTYILKESPEAQVTAIERNRTLADVLSAKGFAVDYSDFLEHQGSYDRIVMNPPFEKGQDIDHIQHAYLCLAPGGRIVSVMSEGAFSRSDNKAVRFQRWYGSIGGYSIQLPEDAFKTADAFRQTGVRTRLIVLDKEE